MLTRAIGAPLAGFGIAARIGREGVEERLLEFRDGEVERDRRITACHRASEVGRRLVEIPDAGPLLASVLIPHAPNPKAFSSWHNLAA